MALLISLGVVVLLALGVVAIYNRLVTLRNRFENSFAQVDVQLKRRHDLIPNLVATVKGYMRHERETLENVVAARSAAETARKRAADDPRDAQAVERLSAAEGGLGQSLGRLLLLWEAYPDLKADTAARGLMEELASAENRVAFARQAYNDAVMAYNTAREVFPSNLFAGAFGFEPAALYRVDDESERAVPSARLD